MKRALLLLGSLVLPFLLLEALLRLTGAGGPAEHPSVFDRRTLFYRPHPTRLHPHTPVQGEFLKVALIGDSFTFGSASDWDDAFGRRLERLLNLNEDTPPAEVRIWARKGSATVQQIKFLHKAVAYRPDLLILAIFLNDPADPSDSWLGISRELQRPRTPSGWKLSLVRSSRALGWLYQLYENQRSRRAQRAYMEYLYDPEYSGWKRFTGALGEFARTTREAEIPFVAVILPGMGSLGSGANRFAHERIAAVLEHHRVATLDLAEVFSDKAPIRMSAYPLIDTHPSEIAHRIAAHEILDFLLAGEFLDPSYRPKLQSIHRTDEDWLKRLRQMESAIYVEP